MIDKEGIPTTFIKCLVELEDFIKEVWLTLSSLARRRQKCDIYVSWCCVRIKMILVVLF